MKKTILFCLMAAAMVCSCQKEEPGNETNKGNSGTSATIYIDGETVNPPVNVRSTDGTVYFEGGYATGAGIYDGKARPTVEAHPDKGYEVDFFYGGPESDPKKYDYITSGETTFNVALNGADHYFKCGFKEKKRTLTVNAGTGGTATGGGTYQCDTPISITASPNSGYEFAGWEINEGDVQIENPTAANTTATLISLNSTITAKFKRTTTELSFYVRATSTVSQPSNASVKLYTGSHQQEYIGDVRFNSTAVMVNEDVFSIVAGYVEKYQGIYVQKPGKPEEKITSDRLITIYAKDYEDDTIFIVKCF